MDDTRKKKIAEKVWKSSAKEVRKKLDSILATFSFYKFMEQQETFSIGKKIWEKLDQIEYSDPKDLAIALKRLLDEKNEDQIYWFHKYTNEAGALVAMLGDVINQYIDDGKFSLAEDLLLADLDLEYGLFYEIGEYKTFLRYWGF